MTCQLPLLKVSPLLNCQSEKQRQTFINNFILHTSKLKENIKGILDNNSTFVISPLIPAQLMNVSYLSHLEQHHLHTQNNNLVCIENKDIMLITAFYNALCRDWQNMCIRNLKAEISGKEFTKYESLMQGKHVECYSTINQNPSAVSKGWLTMMKLFLNKLMDIKCIYKDLDKPDLKPQKEAKNFNKKFRHIVFIGSKEMCKTLKSTSSERALFIEENLGLFDLQKAQLFAKSLRRFPEDSLFIALFDYYLIADEVSQNDFSHVNTNESFLVPKNLNKKNNNLIKEIITKVDAIITVLKKSLPLNSYIVVSPIRPSIGFWIKPSQSELRVLTLIRRSKPNVIFLYGAYTYWTHLVNILKFKWGEYMKNIFEQGGLSASIPFTYAKKQKYIINITSRPNIILKIKDLSELWFDCLQNMKSHFLSTDSLLPINDENHSATSMPG